MDVRSAEPSEVPPLATLWYHAWQDAHASILPAALDAPLGFALIADAEARLRDAGVELAWDPREA